jgi:hypothetical protein
MKNVFVLFVSVLCLSNFASAASPGSWTPASEIQNICIEGSDAKPLVTITLINVNQ